MSSSWARSVFKLIYFSSYCPPLKYNDLEGPADLDAYYAPNEPLIMLETSHLKCCKSATCCVRSQPLSACGQGVKSGSVITAQQRLSADRMIERHSDPLFVSIASRVPETGPSARLGRPKPGPVSPIDQTSILCMCSTFAKVVRCELFLG